MNMSKPIQCRSALSRRNGYTLVEMLVLITIMGIAGAMVIPAMGQTGVLRIQAAVRSVVADITFAQMDALAYQESRAVVFDVDVNSYTLVQVIDGVVDIDANALYNSKGLNERYTVDFNQERYGGSTLQNVNLNGGSMIIFDELGGPVASAGSSELSDGGSVEITGQFSTFRINIAAFTGRVTVTRLD
ncbi:MAG: prepilin-type N-terminal cleavage/methylation domain-containing protein [Phycisphaerales bacterium]|nr:prepilin-type N-terminal cleavage/methylation domain-containing protein [Phycisphaerales bacterium]